MMKRFCTDILYYVKVFICRSLYFMYNRSASTYCLAIKSTQFTFDSNHLYLLHIYSVYVNTNYFIRTLHTETRIVVRIEYNILVYIWKYEDIMFYYIDSDFMVKKNRTPREIIYCRQLISATWTKNIIAFWLRTWNRIFWSSYKTLSKNKKNIKFM